MSLTPKHHGMTSKQEAAAASLVADTRSVTRRFLDSLSTRGGILSFMSFWLICAVAVPTISPLAFLVGGIFFLFTLENRGMWHPILPFKLPMEAKRRDFNDPLPGRKSVRMAAGAVYVGNTWPLAGDGPEGEELWLSFNDVLTHILVLGTTGSGKTEFLVSYLCSAGLATGSGGAYIDPKGDIKLASQIFILCRMLGRDDDFRLLNYNTGGKLQNRKTCRRLSNDTNPLAFGGADDIAQTLNALIPEPEGQNAVFVQGAHTLMVALIYALVELRDSGTPISIATIREYIEPERFAMLSMDERLTEATRGTMHAFMTSVQWRDDAMKPIIEARMRVEKARKSGNKMLDVPAPGQQKSNAGEEAQILEAYYTQYGYAKSYWAMVLGSLVDTYGYIYRPPRPEVDIPDVIMQRRIFTALLPALSKSPTEVRSIGRVNLSMFRNAIAIGLGSKAEGTLDDVIYSRPSAAAKPFPLIADEYAAIAVDGFELVLTQARSLGIAAAIGNQDYAGLTKAGEKGDASAKQIVSNTNLKLAMKLNDPQETAELLTKLAGESEVAKFAGYQQPENGAGSFSKKSGVNILSKCRIDIRDLQNQIEGEFHGFFRGTIVRGLAFYSDTPLKKEYQIRIHEMLKVMPPDKEYLERVYGIPRLIGQHLAEYVDSPSSFCADEPVMDGLETVRQIFAQPLGLSRNEQAVAVIAAMINEQETALSDIQKQAAAARALNQGSGTSTNMRETKKDYFDLDADTVGEKTEAGKAESGATSVAEARPAQSEPASGSDPFGDDEFEVVDESDGSDTALVPAPDTSSLDDPFGEAEPEYPDTVNEEDEDGSPENALGFDFDGDVEEVDDEDEGEEGGSGSSGFDGLPPAAGPGKNRHSVSNIAMGSITEQAVELIRGGLVEEMAQLAMALGTPTSKAIDQAHALEDAVKTSLQYPVEPVPEVTDETAATLDNAIERIIDAVNAKRAARERNE